jgi:hypothetical protein
MTSLPVEHDYSTIASFSFVLAIFFLKKKKKLIDFVFSPSFSLTILVEFNLPFFNYN